MSHHWTDKDPVSQLLRAVRNAEQFVAKASAEGNIFAERALRNLEVAVDRVEAQRAVRAELSDQAEASA